MKKPVTATTAGPDALETPGTPVAPPLARYRAKRDFSQTAEPEGALAAPGEALQFVIQKHWASHLHYDLRLELDGVMRSWAVPKGPSLDPAVKRMAIEVEDHPVSYNTFEGEIPKGQYGGGTVIVWDRGTWRPEGDARAGLAQGKLVFALQGHKLAGRWELVRISKPGAKKQNQWLLFKKRGDAWARAAAQYDVTTALPDSVVQHPLGLLEERGPHGGVAPPAELPVPPQAPPHKRPQAKKPDQGPEQGGHHDNAPLLQSAPRAPLPEVLAPQLATLVTSVPAGDWIVESKFDGYRLLARIDGAQVRLFTRNGNDWTDRLRPLAEAVAQLGLRRAWLDGEIVVLDDAGVPVLNRLQNAIDNARAQDIVLFVFDLPYLGERDLRGVPLRARRAVLEQLFAQRASASVRFSPAFELPPAQMLAAACALGLEGVIVKDAQAPYVAGRTSSWMKLKCQLRQEFIVLGYTERAGAARQVGSLLLGYYEEGALHQAGAVGTGWDAALAGQLYARLDALQVDAPLAAAHGGAPSSWSRRRAASVHWVTPSLVVEVAFAEWTPARQVRHAVFRGIRADKPPAQVVREQARAAAPAPACAAPPASTSTVAGVRISHGQRVIDPGTGLRKIDLVRYYEALAERMLAHLRQRPVSLVRAPTGVGGALFFQKHPEGNLPDSTALDPALWPGHAALLAIDSEQALIAAVQMNVVEFHTWNARTTRILQPDRFILDLDPGAGVSWAQLVEGAELTHVLLTELGLDSWLKTSGGKGLHVVVPITPRLDFHAVKAFSQALARHLAQVIPSKFTAVMGEKNRVGKIFIDYLRNGPAQTTACAYSARARPGLGVSMPVAWEQLRDLHGSAQWTIATAPAYLRSASQDPWRDFWTKKQSIARAMRQLG